MKKTFIAFFQKLTFRRQLGITVTLGILFLALCSSLVGSWQGNKRVRNDLIEQGRRITENLANQSSLALIYGSADNVSEAVKTTIVFPGVIGVEIRDTKGHVLLSRGNTSIAEFLDPADRGGGLHAATMLDAESGNAWYFSAPVYSQPAAESPFSEAAAPELLGQVSVIMSKKALSRMTTDIFISNLTTSFSFALLFLFVIRRLTNSITRPLNELSAGMGRAQSGESQVRVEPAGPKDITNMAHAFNRMMSVLEEREAALRIAAIAFETEEGMMVTDEDATIIRVNQAFTRMTGYSPEEAVGRKPSMLKSDRQDAEFYRRMWASLHRDNIWQGEIWNRRKNGEVYPEWLNVTAVLGADGKVTNYVGSFVDFTERKKAESEIHQLAYYDPLSQLPNRRLLLDRLRQAVATGARNQTGGALMFIDLDNFKPLNDEHGHHVGDLLLVEVARRISNCVREQDTVARFGGDEFIVMLNELTADKESSRLQAGVVAEKIRSILAEPYLLSVMHEGETAPSIVKHRCTSSIGVVLFINHENSEDDLIKWADMAMYQAKEGGRNRVHFFES